MMNKQRQEQNEMAAQHQLVADLNNTLERIQLAWSGRGAMWPGRDGQPDNLCVLAAAAEVTTGNWENWRGFGTGDIPRFMRVANILFTALMRRNREAYYPSGSICHVAQYNDSHKLADVKALVENAIEMAAQ